MHLHNKIQNMCKAMNVCERALAIANKIREFLNECVIVAGIVKHKAECRKIISFGAEHNAMSYLVLNSVGM